MSDTVVVDNLKFKVPTLPLQMHDGGLGCEMTCGDVSSRVALVGVGASRVTAVICNRGTVWASVRLGGSQVEATLACKTILPGDEWEVLLEKGQTHMAGITAAGQTSLQCTLGYGA